MTIFRHTLATRTVVSALALAGVLLLTIATGGFAACTSDADAAQKASSFVANPSSLLNGPNGPRSVDDGTGLGKASNDCKVPDLAFATEIQIQLAGAGSADANAQYAAVTGNNPTGTVAAGGGAAGSPGEVGGSTGGSGGSSSGSAGVQAFAANSVSNNPTNFFGASVGGAGADGGGAGTTTTVVCTVSNSC
jgi:hypothetical protein